MRKTGCTGDGAAEAQFTQLGGVGDEPNGAMLVIGSGALWGGGFVTWEGGGWGYTRWVKSLPPEPSSAVRGQHYTLVTERKSTQVLNKSKT